MLWNLVGGGIRCCGRGKEKRRPRSSEECKHSFRPICPRNRSVRGRRGHPSVKMLLARPSCSSSRSSRSGGSARAPCAPTLPALAALPPRASSSSSSRRMGSSRMGRLALQQSRGAAAAAAAASDQQLQGPAGEEGGEEDLELRELSQAAHIVIGSRGGRGQGSGVSCPEGATKRSGFMSVVPPHTPTSPTLQRTALPPSCALRCAGCSTLGLQVRSPKCPAKQKKG